MIPTIFFLIWILISQSLAITIKGSVKLPENAHRALDPERASITVLPSNTSLSNTYHFTKNGTFELPLHKGSYSVLIHSLDFKLMYGDEYMIDVVNDTNYKVTTENGKGETIEIPSGLVFSEVKLRHFADVDPSGSFLNSIPFIPIIKRYPIVGIILGFCLVVVLSITIMSKIDPDFNQKFIDAQNRAAMESEKKNN